MHKIIRLFQPSFKDVKQTFIAEVSFNIKNVYECLPDDTKEINFEKCLPICEKYDIFGLSEEFIGEMDFYKYIT